MKREQENFQGREIQDGHCPLKYSQICSIQTTPSNGICQDDIIKRNKIALHAKYRGPSKNLSSKIRDFIIKGKVLTGVAFAGGGVVSTGGCVLGILKFI